MLIIIWTFRALQVSQLSYSKKILCIQYVNFVPRVLSYPPYVPVGRVGENPGNEVVTMSAHLPLKPHIPVACVQTPPPPTPPFRKNPIFPEGRVVCTQANIPVTVWFIENENWKKRRKKKFRINISFSLRAQWWVNGGASGKAIPRIPHWRGFSRKRLLLTDQ